MEQDAYEIFTQAHRVYMKGIRAAISERLQSAYGSDWWERGVMSAVGENQRDNIQRDIEKGTSGDLTQLLDTAHFARIVERNHAVAFANDFTNIDYTLRVFRLLSVRRNEWAHVQVSKWFVPEIMQTVQAMREILMQLRRREALEIHEMFQESLDQQGGIQEELLVTMDESSADSEDSDFSDNDHSLLRFWKVLEAYLVVDSQVLPDETERKDRNGNAFVNVLVRVTNTAPVGEGRPNIRFNQVVLETVNAEHQRGSNGNLGTIEPGRTAERSFSCSERSLASVEFQVSAEVDWESLSQVKQRAVLPKEIVNPLLQELGNRFEGMGIDENLAVVVQTVSKIHPEMTLLEIPNIRRQLADLKPLIAEKRETLGELFREFHIVRESSLGRPLREIILLLEDLERNKLSALEEAIGETDLESISSVAHDIEQLQLSVMRVRETIRSRLELSRQ